MRKLNITLITLLFFFGNHAIAQDQISKRSATINAFLSAVFKEKRDTRFIMENCMYVANDTISRKKKETIVSAMIAKFKEHNKALPFSNYKICNYDEFKGNKKVFNGADDKDIMLLVVKNQVVDYLYFKGDRLISFFYIDKGSISFFVTI